MKPVIRKFSESDVPALSPVEAVEASSAFCRNHLQRDFRRVMSLAGFFCGIIRIRNESSLSEGCALYRMK